MVDAIGEGALTSVIIPTRNAGPQFGETLNAIFRQRVDSDLEVVVIDSGSVDGTVSLVQEYPVTLLQIPPSAFNHGRTRNLAIAHAQGDFVVLLVQDALPANEAWLRNLILPLKEDVRLAGAYSRQVPRPEADFFTHRMYSMWGVSAKQPRKMEIDDMRAYEDLSWRQKAHVCAFSNVSSVLRRSIWEEVPFPPTEYAEDLAWAKTVLEKGYRILYAPDSVVIHSHQRPWKERLRRAYVDGRTVAEIFEADVAFPRDDHLQAMASLLSEELTGGTRRITCAAQSGLDLLRSLPPGGVRLILSEASPWMPASTGRRRIEVFLDKLVGTVGRPGQWKIALERAVVAVWLSLLSAPALGQLFRAAFERRYAHRLTRIWEDWILFWAILSAGADAPLPAGLTKRLLTYTREFLPAPEEEVPDICMNALIDVVGKRLGQAAWAAKARGIDSVSLQRIQQWILASDRQP